VWPLLFDTGKRFDAPATMQSPCTGCDNHLWRLREKSLAGLTRQEITRLVNRYIGVSGGYLGDFSYRTHTDFYPEFCDLDINPNDYPGTTRERFITILTGSSPAVQAKIVRGILAKYHPGPAPNATRTQQLHDEFLAVARRLEGTCPVASPTLTITSEVVERAISDAEALIRSGGATSAVDRLHTTVHGYLRAVCDQAGIAYKPDSTMAALFKALREQHPAFSTLGPRAQDITQIMRAMATIMDVFNPIRNSASVAHPNSQLLEGPEAALAINAARTILHYLDAKLGA
jgi:hypothetical protein